LLPLSLALGGFRTVHACWHSDHLSRFDGGKWAGPTISGPPNFSSLRMAVFAKQMSCAVERNSFDPTVPKPISAITDFNTIFFHG
jgi:hypothetical protein